MSDAPRHSIAAILPCRDLDASTAFYERLGLKVVSDHGSYRLLDDGAGWQLHLTNESPQEWLVPGQNPFGLYLYTEKVAEIAKAVRSEERRVGKEWVSTGRSRWSPYH